MPIPRAVLEGETAGMCRRDFLRNGAVAFLTVYGASMLSWGQHLGGGLGAGGDAVAPIRSSSRSSWTAATTA